MPSPYSPRALRLQVGVCKENADGETRVALVPCGTPSIRLLKVLPHCSCVVRRDNVTTLMKKGAKVQVEKGAGLLSGYEVSARQASVKRRQASSLTRKHRASGRSLRGEGSHPGR